MGHLAKQRKRKYRPGLFEQKTPTTPPTVEIATTLLQTPVTATGRVTLGRVTTGDGQGFRLVQYTDAAGTPLWPEDDTAPGA